MGGFTEKLLLALKGLAMGIAEVIPGVSGGTIAFITGIYEELLTAIKAILGPEIFRALKRGGIPEAWKTIHGNFLVCLMLGMVTGLVIGIFGVSHLLENYPILIWALFFGLILASALVISWQVRPWGLVEVLCLVVTTAFTYYITVATPAQGPQALWFVFIAGAIAISALMLPGISGSLMLLLMGMYTLVIGSVKSVLSLDFAALPIVIAFALGALLGMGTFSRVLTWLFKHYHNATMAAMTGFMLGSLNRIWPWRNVLETYVDRDGEVKPLVEQSVLPMHFEGGDTMLAVAILMMVIGFAAVIATDIASRKKAPEGEPAV